MADGGWPLCFIEQMKFVFYNFQVQPVRADAE